MLLVGCSNENPTSKNDWFVPTAEEAIKKGLVSEGTDDSAILSIEEVAEETIVFYENYNAITAATIAESEYGFTWYRSMNYFTFEGEESDYMSAGFDFETYGGQNIKVVAGRVFDKSISEMILQGDGAERILKVDSDSGLFFAIHQRDFSKLKVEPVVN